MCSEPVAFIRAIPLIIGEKMNLRIEYPGVYDIPPCEVVFSSDAQGFAKRPLVGLTACPYLLE
ncbi:MAG: hypothetical protein CM15mP3_04730 [Candidatus Poseidoniales archaeon]|nr:MAG: hypothetical protein CM15mP3_04730 [Candidatus Poseidoniales archaeon]